MSERQGGNAYESLDAEDFIGGGAAPDRIGFRPHA
jgi:hypothetical protein